MLFLLLFYYSTLWYFKSFLIILDCSTLNYISRKPPPFATSFSTSFQLQTKSKITHSYNLFFAILTNNVDKYKSRVKL